ncbi:MAG TPA: hypothetical protein VNE39_01235 [Planctomycetota bacterium]|nr:hypothetical protein [Planctomycetota bacterium]
MDRRSILLFTLALIASPLVAGEPPKKEAPAPPPPRRIVVRPWMLPPYLLLGLPRDILDAPTKGISSIPVFNKIFFAPLMVLNGITTTLSWSYTEDGSAGGYAAWVACLHLPRKPKAAPPRHIPVHLRYFPNLRTFGIVYWKPIEPPPKTGNAAPPPR